MPKCTMAEQVGASSVATLTPASKLQTGDREPELDTNSFPRGPTDLHTASATRSLSDGATLTDRDRGTTRRT